MTTVKRFTRWLRRRRTLRRRRFNPYVVGTPVFDARVLFGREKLAARILGLLATRSVRLTGEHRIGKTSFLHHLKNTLDAQRGSRGFVPVFVDLEAAAPRPSRALIEETIETLALTPTVLGLRLDGRHHGYEVQDLVHDLKRVVDHLRVRTRTDAKLVFLVDEVDAVLQDASSGGEAWLDTLLRDCREEVRVVVAGVTAGGPRPGDARGDQDWVEDLVLEPLGPEDARELVTRPVGRRFEYEPAAVERIVQLAHGRPYILQKLCLNSLNRMLDEERTTVRLADVEAVAALEAFGLTRPRLTERFPSLDHS